MMTHKTYLILQTVDVCLSAEWLGLIARSSVSNFNVGIAVANARLPQHGGFFSLSVLFHFRSHWVVSDVLKAEVELSAPIGLFPVNHGLRNNRSCTTDGSSRHAWTLRWHVTVGPFRLWPTAAFFLDHVTWVICVYNVHCIRFSEI